MEGADRIYKIVRLAYHYKLAGFNRDYGGIGAVKRGNIVLVAGEHARGGTAHVILEHGDSKLEVYGITGGNHGWTETYGWLKKGSWVGAVEKLLNELEQEIRDIRREQDAELIEAARQRKLSETEKARMFEALFADTGVQED